MTLPRISLVLGLAIAPAFSQSLEFEVASVKPGEAVTATEYEKGFRAGQSSQGMIIKGNRVTMVDQTLLDLVRIAYQVKPYQITGEKWMGTERYQIAATLPSGRTAADAPEMLLNLLASRFHLAVRHESKEMPVYALVAGKDGPKMKAADGAPQSNAGLVKTEMQAKQLEMSLVREKREAEFSGTRRLRGQYTMASLADRLSNLMDHPVFNMTGIDGKFDIDLNYTVMDASDSGSGIASSLPQIGLKLEPRKLPVAMIAIEKADKVPTEN